MSSTNSPLLRAGSPPIWTPESIEIHRLAVERAASLPLPPESRALAIAAVAHQYQFRKGSGLPYLTHIIDVYGIVCCVSGATLSQRLASILHDYDEDEEFTCSRPGDIRRWFGDEPADYVGWLSNVSRPADGKRAVRRELDREHSAKSPPAVQTVKYADVLSNARNIVQELPSFARVWLPEKVRLLEAIPNGDPDLRNKVVEVLGHQMSLLSAIERASFEQPRPMRPRQ